MVNEYYQMFMDDVFPYLLGGFTAVFMTYAISTIPGTLMVKRRVLDKLAKMEVEGLERKVD